MVLGSPFLNGKKITNTKNVSHILVDSSGILFIWNSIVSILWEKSYVVSLQFTLMSGQMIELDMHANFVEDIRKFQSFRKPTYPRISV